MRLKKIMIATASTIILSAPLVSLAFINFFPKETNGSKRFIINDSETSKAILDLKNALDNTIGNNKDSKLNLKFYTLTNSSQYTPSKLSWFTELNNALKWMDSRLSFELVPRSNATVEQGFRQKDGEMISMFWSPDYHNIGTWIGFWFNGNYTVPNLWPALYNDMTDGTIEPWQESLKKYLKDDRNIGGDPNYFRSYDDLTQLDLENYKKGKKTSYRSLIGDEIGYWADTTSQDNSKELVSWMNAQAAMLPWISDGPSSTKKIMVRKGYSAPTNTYSTDTYRDWFYNGADGSSKKFRYWVSSSPFATNKTPYNASFNDSSNNGFFQSTYNGLTDWKINGDWEWDSVNNSWIAPKGTLTLGSASKVVATDSSGGNQFTLPASGSLSSNSQISDFTIYEDGNANQIDSVKGKLEKVTKYTFDIDPTRFTWNSMSGPTQHKLTAKDYFWGFIGYLLSIDLNINTNGYYLDLVDLDIEETIKANQDFFDFYYSNASSENKYASWNLKPKTNIDDSVNKSITFILKKPNVNFIDILSKQYFQPLPIMNQKVRNIFAGPDGKDLIYKLNGNPTEPKELSLTFDISNTNYANLYGCESDPTGSMDWWSAGAYYVKNVTEQDITFNKNNNFFDQFPEGMYGEKNKKIGEVVMKYGGAFSDQLTYIQFKNGELDKSNIPISLIPEAAKWEGFTTQGVSLINRSDIISYNTNVFKRDSNGISYLTTSSDSDRVVQTIEGETRVLKDNVARNYYNAIVKDFAVKDGNSMKIRKAINIAIDWYSLASIAVPDDNPNFQQSVIPFGNFKLLNSNGQITTFTEIANSDSKYALARNGVSNWTIQSYQAYWEKQFGLNKYYLPNKKDD